MVIQVYKLQHLVATASIFLVAKLIVRCSYRSLRYYKLRCLKLGSTVLIRSSQEEKEDKNLARGKRILEDLGWGIKKLRADLNDETEIASQPTFYAKFICYWPRP